MPRRVQPTFAVCICSRFPKEDDRGIADFALVDFGVMFKFIEMEEVRRAPESARSALWPDLIDQGPPARCRGLQGVGKAGAAPEGSEHSLVLLQHSAKASARPRIRREYLEACRLPGHHRSFQVWDNEDFIIYFEGHWETWEFNKDTQSVRLLSRCHGEQAAACSRQAPNERGEVGPDACNSERYRRGQALKALLLVLAHN